MGSLRPPPSSPASGGLAQALADLPIFPLPNAVLLPGGVLPLHVFEPRYVAMTRHALATHKAIAIALILEGPNDAHGHPPIAMTAGAGTIVDFSELPDGRLYVVLNGEARVSLEELAFVPPFRRAKATILVDEPSSASRQDVSALLAIASAFATEVRAKNPSFDVQIPTSVPPDRAADIIAHYLVIDAQMRQSLLELRNPSERMQRTIEAIAAQRALLAGTGSPSRSN